MTHLYDAGLTTDGIILLSMLAVVALAWVGCEWGEG
jgi:uncharacterized protein YciW